MDLKHQNLSRHVYEMKSREMWQYQIVTYYFSSENICCGYDTTKILIVSRKKKDIYSVKLIVCIYLTDIFSDYVIN